MWRSSHSLNANFDFQNLSNANANRGIYFISLNGMHWFRSIKWLLTQQDAQLLQRDRAAGCIIVFAKIEDWNWETICYGHYRSIFNHSDIIGLKVYQIRRKKRKIRAITAFKVIQGHRGRYQTSLQRGHFDSKFPVEGVIPTNNFCTDS